jgi:hypothetical protein
MLGGGEAEREERVKERSSPAITEVEKKQAVQELLVVGKNEGDGGGGGWTLIAEEVREGLEE